MLTDLVTRHEGAVADQAGVITPAFAGRFEHRAGQAFTADYGLLPPARLKKSLHRGAVF